MTGARLGGLLLGVGGFLGGCVGTPRVSGVPGASPAPQVPWTPPASTIREVTPADTSSTAPVPTDLGDRIRRLTLG